MWSNSSPDARLSFMLLVRFLLRPQEVDDMDDVDGVE